LKRVNQPIDKLNRRQVEPKRKCRQRAQQHGGTQDRRHSQGDSQRDGEGEFFRRETLAQKVSGSYGLPPQNGRGRLFRLEPEELNENIEEHIDVAQPYDKQEPQDPRTHDSACFSALSNHFP
jgi:hypothetical protein